MASLVKIWKQFRFFKENIQLDKEEQQAAAQQYIFGIEVRTGSEDHEEGDS